MLEARTKMGVNARSSSAVTEEMARAGYALEAGPDFLPYQYLLIFRPR